MDEIISLPEDTRLILEQFLKEKQEREALELNSTDDIGRFEENWQLSQFWYDDKTKTALSNVCLSIAETNNWKVEETKIGLLSSPSLFSGIKTLGFETYLFEYDQRFNSYGDSFVFYDYTEADTSFSLDKFGNFFDIIIADPPFLSEECIEKMGKIIRKITKEESKVILCSGKVVQEWAQKHLNLELTAFEPTHQRNLGNEFASFANFDLSKVIEQSSRPLS